MATLQTAHAPSHNPDSSVKETVTSIVIAFVVAFVFRGFVLEPFLIPTGSMAPTLMGAHMRFTGPDTGYSWPVGPWVIADQDSQTPERVQFDPRDQHRAAPVVVRDPMTRQELPQPGVLSRAGDRIFVLKSLYNVFDPRRFEVIVFKNPSNPAENYIKRLTALPGEQVAIVDGDIFVRKLETLAPSAVREGPGAWDDTSWHIARKPERVQHSVWQPVFDSRNTPLPSLKGSSNSFNPPWVGGKGWEISGKLIYAYTGSGSTSLRWDTARREITDDCVYNQTPNQLGGVGQSLIFPVSDVRVGLAIKPAAAGASLAFDLLARRHEFRAEITGREAVLKMRPAPIADPVSGTWTTIGQGTLDEALPAGVFTDVEFWHADQSIRLYVAGSLVAHAEYDWSPAQRVDAALGMSVAQATADDGSAPAVANPTSYQSPTFRIDFDGGPFELARVALARDLYYQPCSPPDYQGRSKLAFGATPARMPTLNSDQFFVCGDNSPASSDARLWTRVDPWIKEQVDPTVGVVNRDLLVGRAFFVYFPAPVPGKHLWMPDFGRLRFIW